MQASHNPILKKIQTPSPDFAYIILEVITMIHSICEGEQCLLWIAGRMPDAAARIYGGKQYAQIHGKVLFYQRIDGVFVMYQINGLPKNETTCGNSIFAMHIHDGGRCRGTSADPFADAGAHFNPQNCPHPAHAGDLPPLFANDGDAWGCVFTNRFRVEEIIGKTVIIHSGPDDFSSQPAGNAGTRIACGVIIGVSQPHL